MDIKKDRVPGYGRGRALSRNNIDSRPVGILDPREWYQRVGHTVFGRGQQQFAAMFAGDMRVPHFGKSGGNINNPGIGKNAGRGHVSWADIRHQSLANVCQISPLDAYASTLDKSHNSSNRIAYMGGAWGGRGRGILEKTSSDDENSCHSSENYVWGGRGRGSILCAPKDRFNSANFRCKNSIFREQNRPHSGQFRGGHMKSEKIYTTNKQEQLTLAMPAPIPMQLPLLLQKLNINSTYEKQVQNKQKKKQRKNWPRERKRGSLGVSGPVKSAKNDGENASPQTVQQSDKETETKQHTSEGDLPSVESNTKRLVIINAQEGGNFKLQNEQENPSKSHQTDGVREQVIVERDKTLSNSSEKDAEKYKTAINGVSSKDKQNNDQK